MEPGLPLAVPPPVVVRPGTVVPIDLPPSTIDEPPTPSAGDGDAILLDRADPGEQAPVALASDGAARDLADTPEANDEGAAAAAPAEDVDWAAVQERRRQEINALESPIVDRLNAEVAARAAAETRRIEEERADYERSLREAEVEAHRVQAEHEAAMAEHARRVEREQAEYRARVAACLDGERRACRPDI